MALVIGSDPRGPGGIRRASLRIATGMAARHGVEVDIVTLEPQTVADGPGPLCEPPYELAPGVLVHRFGSWTGSTATDNGGRIADTHEALLALVGRRGHDLLHALAIARPAFQAVYAGAQLDLPVLVSARGSDVMREPFQPHRFAQTIWTLQRATGVTAMNRAMARDIVALAQPPTAPEVIFNGVDPGAYLDGTVDLGLSGPVIGAMSVFRPTKGTRYLIAAFEQVLERWPTATLLLVGYFRPQEAEGLEDMVSSPEVLRRIVVTGAVEPAEVLRYVRAMDVFVSASIRDACPNAVLEAMLARRAIVATRVGACPDMLRDGELGRLVEPGSAEALRDAVLELLTVDRELLGERAARAAAREWSVDVELAAWARAYERCLDRHGGEVVPLRDSFG